MKLLNYSENTVDIILSVLLSLNLVVVFGNIFSSSILGGILNFLILPLPAILLFILVWKPDLLQASL